MTTAEEFRCDVDPDFFPDEECDYEKVGPQGLMPQARAELERPHPPVRGRGDPQRARPQHGGNATPGLHLRFPPQAGQHRVQRVQCPGTMRRNGASTHTSVSHALVKRMRLRLRTGTDTHNAGRRRRDVRTGTGPVRDAEAPYQELQLRR